VIPSNLDIKQIMQAAVASDIYSQYSKNDHGIRDVGGTAVWYLHG
jgi:hypothetical protein